MASQTSIALATFAAILSGAFPSFYSFVAAPPGVGMPTAQLGKFGPAMPASPTAVSPPLPVAASTVVASIAASAAPSPSGAPPILKKKRARRAVRNFPHHVRARKHARS